jgi:putative hydrolase of the HAD superfamily
MARLVIFDVDNVVVRYDRSRRVAVMAERLGRSEPEIWAAVFGSGIEDAADAGELSAEEYLAALGERLGVPVSREVWVDARAAATVPDPPMVVLLAVVARRIPVVLLTNNGSLLREEYHRIAPEVSALGLEMHASGDLRLAKPDPAVFRTVARLHGVAPEDALFVDDSAEYVAGAREAGLRAHRFTGIDELLVFLDGEGVDTRPVDA